MRDAVEAGAGIFAGGAERGGRPPDPPSTARIQRRRPSPALCRLDPAAASLTHPSPLEGDDDNDDEAGAAVALLFLLSRGGEDRARRRRAGAAARGDGNRPPRAQIWRRRPSPAAVRGGVGRAQRQRDRVCPCVRACVRRRDDVDDELQRPVRFHRLIMSIANLEHLVRPFPY